MVKVKQLGRCTVRDTENTKENNFVEHYIRYMLNVLVFQLDLRLSQTLGRNHVIDRQKHRQNSERST